MKNVKVNYRDITGKATSTTINGIIAYHYYSRIFKGGTAADVKDWIDDEKAYKKTIQSFVNSMEEPTCKSLIEGALLIAIYDEGVKTGELYGRSPF